MDEFRVICFEKQVRMSMLNDAKGVFQKEIYLAFLALNSVCFESFH